MRGWVYIFSNKGMPGLLKIGYTDRDPVVRAEELASTGVPHKFEVEYEVLVANAQDYEQKLHAHLSGCREAKNREFFRCTLHQAIAAIDEIVPTTERIAETRSRPHDATQPLGGKTGQRPLSEHASRFYERTNPQNHPVRRLKYEIRYRDGKRYINGVQEVECDDDNAS